MAVRAVTVDLLNSDGTTAQSGLSVIGGFYAEDSNDAAPCELEVADRATGATSITQGMLLRYKVGGTADRTCVVEKVQMPERRTIPSDGIVKVSGSDWVKLFDDALVPPPTGVLVPVGRSVYFNHAHPSLDRSAWTTPSNIGAVYTADLDPFDSAQPASPTGKNGIAPQAWPDVFSTWYWSEAVDGVTFSHDEGDVYFYKSFTLASETTVAIVWSVDDAGELWLDGVLLDRTEAPAVTWTNGRIAAATLAAGTHYLSVKATNTPYNRGLYNPGGLALTCYKQTTSSDLFINSNAIFRTGFSPGGGTDTTGGNWKCLGYPASAPGFKPGPAFKILFDAVQADGGLSGWSLSGSGSTDAAGNAWTATTELVARCEDTLLDTLKSWHDGGFIDFAADASSKTLKLWRWGERPGTTRTLATTDVASVTTEYRR